MLTFPKQKTFLYKNRWDIISYGVYALLTLGFIYSLTNTL